MPPKAPTNTSAAAASITDHDVKALVALLNSTTKEVCVDFHAYAAALGLADSAIGKIHFMKLKQKLNITKDIKDASEDDNTRVELRADDYASDKSAITEGF